MKACMRDRLLILSVFVVASCGLAYELIAGALAMLVQIVVHVLLSRWVRDLQQALQDNNTAMGLLAGSVQLAAGVLNAGSLS